MHRWQVPWIGHLWLRPKKVLKKIGQFEAIFFWMESTLQNRSPKHTLIPTLTSWCKVQGELIIGQILWMTTLVKDLHINMRTLFKITYIVNSRTDW